MADTVPRLAPQQGVLRAEGGEILHHRHPALEEGEMVGRGRRLARGAHGSGHAGQPDVQEEARRVLDQGVILLRLHVGVVLRRLAVLEAGVGGDVDAGNAVVLQPDRLRQPGPDVNHVRDDGVPIELGRALPRGGEGQFVVVGHFLAGVAGVLGRELGHERPDRHHVRLAIVQGREIAAQTGLIEALFVGRRWHGKVPTLRVFPVPSKRSAARRASARSSGRRRLRTPCSARHYSRDREGS